MAESKWKLLAEDKEPTDQSADFSDHLQGDSDLIAVLPDLISHYSGWRASHNG